MQATLFNGKGEKRNIVINANVVFTLLTTILLALGGWGLVKLTTMSDAFASKSMVLGLHEQVVKSITCAEEEAEKNDLRLENRIEKRIDRLENTITYNFNHIQSVLEKIQHEQRRDDPQKE